MPTYKTPGVYVEEISVGERSVAEVESAVPAFIGYTEKAQGRGGRDLFRKPKRIDSLQEYEMCFGGAYLENIFVDVDDNNGSFTARLSEPKRQYLLYYCMRLFFANGGGPCYIVSAGNYTQEISDIGLNSGLAAISKLDRPTLIVIPEAVNIPRASGYANVVQAVLKQCASLGDRFGIFDVYGGEGKLDKAGWDKSRELFADINLKYGAAYYPFLRAAISLRIADDPDGIYGANVTVRYPDSSGTMTEVRLTTLKNENPALFSFIRSTLEKNFVVLPPSAAVAGVYVASDNSRGVWKAPANISLSTVVEPVVKVNSEEQEGMNIDIVSGKSINAIRSFTGRGTMIWGARTLAGNDNEWRYIPVRRFFNMVEESVRKSIQWVVFEPNDASTWSKVRVMSENYLTQKWRDGALAGTKADEAFFVNCGLGTSMTSQDIHDDRLVVEIGMAVVRPAEFTILKLSCKFVSH